MNAPEVTRSDTRSAAPRELRDDYVRRVVDEAPPLTEGQRARLAALLTKGAADD